MEKKGRKTSQNLSGSSLGLRSSLDLSSRPAPVLDQVLVQVLALLVSRAGSSPDLPVVEVLVQVLVRVLELVLQPVPFLSRFQSQTRIGSSAGPGSSAGSSPEHVPV